MPRTSSHPTISSVDFYSTETNQSTDVGQLALSQDGRKFRYILNGGVALVTGNLIQGKISDSQFNTLTVTAAAAIGATTIAITNGTTTIAANDFKDGFVNVDTTPGNGQVRRITTHTTGASGAAITLTIDDPLKIALSTSSKVTMKPNMHAFVVQQVSTKSAQSVGGAVIANALSTYGWIQTGGQGNVLMDGTPTTLALEGLTGSAGTAGAATKAVSQDFIVGTSLGVSLTSLNSPCFWTID